MLSVRWLNSIIRRYAMRYDSNTRLLGAIGYPIKQSRSPLLMNRLCNLMNQNFVYVMFEFPPVKMDDAILGLKALNVSGFNVTMPYKQRIMDYLDEISDEARMLEAVNTVKNVDGKLYGYNTDYYGFKQALIDAGIQLEGKRVLVLGAGAISGPVALTMLNGNAEHVTWLNRTKEKADLQAEAMNKIRPGIASSDVLNYCNISKKIEESDIIVNITPVGMSSNSIKMFDFDINRFNENKTVFDVIYTPLKTPILEAAESRGAKVHNGLRMFLNQGKLAFEIWTDTKVPDVFINEIEEIVKEDVKKS